MKTKNLCLLVALAVASASANAAFRCVDEKGRTHIGDTPPAGCTNVVMYEVTRSGTVLRTIQPTMTEEQWKAKLEAEEKAKQAAKAAAEQKRKDMALLATYANEREFDVARDRGIAPLKARIEQSGDRLKEIDKRLKTVKEEMEFYTAGKKKSAKSVTPVAMTSEIERLDEEKKAIQKSINSHESEIAELRTKHDADKSRWIALKSGSAAKPREDEPKSPTTVTLSAGAAGTAKCGDKVYECPAGKTYICREGRRETKVACVVKRD